eukprot:COSAG03_NODE_1367_length_4246_cov_6.674705_5_plen_92_part_00
MQLCEWVERAIAQLQRRADRERAKIDARARLHAQSLLSFLTHYESQWSAPGLVEEESIRSGTSSTTWALTAKTPTKDPEMAAIPADSETEH